jgi:hypothetical protein
MGVTYAASEMAGKSVPGSKRFMQNSAVNFLILIRNPWCLGVELGNIRTRRHQGTLGIRVKGRH